MTLDETDAEILQLLIEDASRSYREIAERVDLTAPTVSERVERLRELGIIRRFTVAVDQSMLSNRGARLVEVQVPPGRADALVSDLRGVEAVEHVFRTESGRIVAHVHANEAELRALFADVLADRDVLAFEVESVVESAWNPDLRRGDFSITCAECGKEITGDAISIDVDDRQYFLCCSSCEALFRDRYETLREGAD